MKFKIGDDIICIYNHNVEAELTVGSHYKVVDTQPHTVTVVNNFDEYLEYFLHRFELETPTETMVEITQNEYDEMQDRIELLESLLVEANNKLEFYENLVITVKSYTKKEGV